MKGEGKTFLPSGPSHNPPGPSGTPQVLCRPVVTQRVDTQTLSRSKAVFSQNRERLNSSMGRRSGCSQDQAGSQQQTDVTLTQVNKGATYKVRRMGFGGRGGTSQTPSTNITLARTEGSKEEQGREQETVAMGKSCLV